MCESELRQAGIQWADLQEGADNRLANIRKLVECFNQGPTAQHIWLWISQNGLEPEPDVF